MTDLTETERNILARYFGMGKGSEIISHPPHATIGLHRHAFDRLKELGLLIETPFNQFGVKRITCTEEAAKIGFARMQENMRAILTDSPALPSTERRTYFFETKEEADEAADNGRNTGGK